MSGLSKFPRRKRNTTPPPPPPPPSYRDNPEGSTGGREFLPMMVSSSRPPSALTDDPACHRLFSFVRRECRDVRSLLLIFMTLFLILSLTRDCSSCCVDDGSSTQKHSLFRFFGGGGGSSGSDDPSSAAPDSMEDSDFSEEEQFEEEEEEEVEGLTAAEIFGDEEPVASFSEENQWRLCNRLVPATAELQADYEEMMNHWKKTGYKKKIFYLDKSMAKKQFGGFPSQLTSLFHAYDKAHDEGATLALQHEGWAHFTLNSFWRIFDNPGNVTAEKHISSIQNLLDIKYVQNQTQFPPNTEVAMELPMTYYYYHSPKLTTEQKRDHRRKILRRLFLRSIRKEEKLEDVCSGLDSLIGKTKDGKYNDDFKYSVIHIIKPGFANKYLPKLNKALKNKYDNRESIEMKPTYVKHLLSQASSSYSGSTGDVGDEVKFLKNKIVLLQDMESPNSEVVSPLKKDSLMKSQIVLPSKDTQWEGSNIMLAVLADVYLGNPVDTLCLWIARMRYALGFNETYVFTTRDDKGEYSRYGEEDLLYDNALGAWTG